MTPVTSYVVRKGCRGPNLALSNDDDGNVLIHARHRLIECRVPTLSVNRIKFPQRPTSSHECMSSMTIQSRCLFQRPSSPTPHTAADTCRLPTTHTDISIQRLFSSCRRARRDLITRLMSRSHGDRGKPTWAYLARSANSPEGLNSNAQSPPRVRS